VLATLPATSAASANDDDAPSLLRRSMKLKLTSSA
jgi:hypothetical protein